MSDADLSHWEYVVKERDTLRWLLAEARWWAECGWDPEHLGLSCYPWETQKVASASSEEDGT